jgi:hypothetical protein
MEFDEQVPVLTARGDALVLVMDDGRHREVEKLALGEYKLALYARYQFVDLVTTDAPPAAGDSRPILYSGNPVAYLDRLLARPNACANIDYVAPSLDFRFKSAAVHHQAACGQLPTQLILPE